MKKAADCMKSRETMPYHFTQMCLLIVFVRKIKKISEALDWFQKIGKWSRSCLRCSCLCSQHLTRHSPAKIRAGWRMIPGVIPGRCTVKPGVKHKPK